MNQVEATDLYIIAATALYSTGHWIGGIVMTVLVALCFIRYATNG